MGLLHTAGLVLIVSILSIIVPPLFKGKETLPMEGFAKPGWEKVEEAFRQMLDSNEEKGANIAIYYKNELVVELAGGFADDEAKIPLNRHSIHGMTGSTMGVSAFVVAMLVKRGLVEYDKPLAKYWPEFGQNGKEEITIEEILSHTAGIPAITTQEVSVYNTHEAIAEALINEPLAWEPGTKQGFHALTAGFLLDQLVRRVDPHQRDLAQFLEQELAEPNSLDIYVGLPLSLSHRVARVYPIAAMDVIIRPGLWSSIYKLSDSDSLTTKTMFNPPEYYKMEGQLNNPRFRLTTNPGMNGFTTAQALANFYNVILNPPNPQNPILSRVEIDNLGVPVSDKMDEIVGIPITYGKGTRLYSTPMGGYMIGSPGVGGQMGYLDPERNLAWSYLTNHHSLDMGPDNSRYNKIQNAMYDCIKNMES